MMIQFFVIDLMAIDNFENSQNKKQANACFFLCVKQKTIYSKKANC